MELRSVSPEYIQENLGRYSQYKLVLATYRPLKGRPKASGRPKRVQTQARTYYKKQEPSATGHKNHEYQDPANTQ